MTNIVICCDGTWNTADRRNGGIPVPTNVVRLYNAFPEEVGAGTKQHRYYHPASSLEIGIILLRGNALNYAAAFHAQGVRLSQQKSEARP